MATIANVNRGRHKPPFKAEQFHPFTTKKQARQATDAEIEALLGPNWHEVKT
jgi:hypothetical protein